MSASLVSELERILKGLDSPRPGQPAPDLGVLSERIARSLGVRPGEVAILGVSERWKHLRFLVPESLKSGYIPLSSTSALAARTARDGRPEIINNFSAVRHASVFEGVKVGDESAEVIQKIMSAPVVSGGKVVGVIQICRKGPSPPLAGPDFTADDLGKVLALAKPLGKLLEHLRTE